MDQNGIDIFKTAMGGAATAAQAKSDSEVADIIEESKIYNEKDNNTFLKQTISIIGAGVSLASQFVFGVKVPLYEGTMGDNFINPHKAHDRELEQQGVDTSRTAIVSRSEAELNSEHPIHKFTRAALDTAMLAINTALFVTTRTTLPTFGTYNKTLEGVADKLKPLRSSSVGTAVNSVHQAWGNILKSKATYHTLTMATAATACTFMGPIGWAIAGAAVATDIARGSIRVNRIQVKADELAHLTSLKQSQDKIKNLENGLSAEIIALRPEAPKTPERKPSFLERMGVSAPKDDLNKATLKAVPGTIFKEAIPVGVALASAAASPAAAITAGAFAFLSWVGGATGKVGEQKAKDELNEKIAHLRTETGINHNPQQSRQYDLAKHAQEMAIYAETLKVANTYKGETDWTANRCREQAETNLKAEEVEKKTKSPSMDYNKLFTNDKVNAPQGMISSAWRSTKSSLLCVGDYLNPIQEATSYEKAHKEHTALPNNSKASITQTASHSHSATAQKIAEKERTSLTNSANRASISEEHTPLINRSRSKSHDQGLAR
ncbi:MAG: hypothetical protein WBJ81_01800 [Rickettsiales bacterium]